MTTTIVDENGDVLKSFDYLLPITDKIHLSIDNLNNDYAVSFEIIDSTFYSDTADLFITLKTK